MAELFVEGAPAFKAQHVAVFDSVLSALAPATESATRADLAARIASLTNAPPTLVGGFYCARAPPSLKHVLRSFSPAYHTCSERNIHFMIYRRICLHLKRVSLLRLTLINMGLLDELISGFTFIGLPLLRNQLGLSYEQIGLIFSVAGCSSMLLDPLLFLLSDRSSKRWWILGGQLGLACAFILAGSAHAFIPLLAAFALMGPAGAAAVALSQAALIDSTPGDSARTMTRWTLLSSIGDFLSAFAVTTIVASGLGWSGMCWIAAGCWLVTAVFVWSQPFPHAAHFHGRGSDDPPVSVLAGLRQVLRDGVLLRWAVLSVLTTMLDEVFLPM